MDVHQQRIEAARQRNLEYIRQLDEAKASREADAFLRQFQSDAAGGHESASAAAAGPCDGDDKHRKRGGNRNSSMYVTGLTTYMACKQLEGVCMKLGKVRRIKFYKDERGGLKGDALVTFASHAMMRKAIERLDHFEIKPGVLITATEATFGSKGTAPSQSSDTAENSSAESRESRDDVLSQQPTRLFGVECLEAPTESQDCRQPDDVLAEETSSKVSASERLELPSRSIILKNSWDPLTPQDNATLFFSELEDDMHHECAKHGSVENVGFVQCSAGRLANVFHVLPGTYSAKRIRDRSLRSTRKRN
ncbi:hypothetical protein PINS_up004459 [Pythium insidiosum]|nr:hypothetical protein PINS_up004459 [Pythium insidiosum]